MRCFVTQAVIAVCLAACSEHAPAPALTRVDPGTGKVDEATSIRIVGSRFFLGVDGHYDSPAPGVDTTFAADLDGAPLASVAWTDLTHLSAVVPPGLPLGKHGLTVRTPTGTSLTLPAAFEVVSDSEPVIPGQAVERLVMVSAAPLVLTADGSDASQVLVRAEATDHTGVPGQTIIFAASAGSLDAVEDLGDGRYRTHFRAATTPAGGRVALTASLGGVTSGPTASTTLRVVASCAGADVRASTWDTFLSAVIAANAGTVHEICVPADSTIPFASGLSLYATADHVIVRGEARATVSGQALDSSTTGLTLAGQSQTVRDLSFTGFAGTALRIAGDSGRVEQVDVLGSGYGIVVWPQVGLGQGIVLRRVLLARNGTGLFVKDSSSVDVAYATFAYQSYGVYVEESSGVRLSNGIFYANAEWAIAASETELAAAPSYNLFFGNGSNCSSCVLGTGNILLDPLLVAPEAGDFRISSKSPALAAGPDLGFGTDLGALPPQ
jgi:hypothetical protein